MQRPDHLAHMRLKVMDEPVKEVQPASSQPLDVPETPVVDKQLTMVLDAFRKSLNMPQKTVVQQEYKIVEAKKPSSDTLVAFLREGRMMLTEYTDASNNFFDLFTNCSQQILISYMKLVYFKSQVSVFSDSIGNQLAPCVTALNEKMKLRLRECLRDNNKKIDRFISTFNTRDYHAFSLQAIEAEHIKMKRACYNCSESNIRKAEQLLKLKDHIQAQSVKAWQEFFTSYNSQLTNSCSDLITSYELLTTEYHLIMQKIVELAPKNILHGIFDISTFDIDVIDRIIQTPHGLLFSDLQEQGPSLICKYLDQKALSEATANTCKNIELLPEQKMQMRPIFSNFQKIFHEYFSRLFQKNMKANLDFSSLLLAISKKVSIETSRYFNIQKQLNTSLILFIGKTIVPYLNKLDEFYGTEILNSVHSNQQTQINLIMDLINRDNATFLHS